jgi:hypothetical protein
LRLAPLLFCILSTAYYLLLTVLAALLRYPVSPIHSHIIS